jgi:hypothetical protein
MGWCSADPLTCILEVHGSNIGLNTGYCDYVLRRMPHRIKDLYRTFSTTDHLSSTVVSGYSRETGFSIEQPQLTVPFNFYEHVLKHFDYEYMHLCKSQQLHEYCTDVGYVTYSYRLLKCSSSRASSIVILAIKGRFTHTMPFPCRDPAILRQRRTQAGRPHAVSGRPMLIHT